MSIPGFDEAALRSITSPSCAASRWAACPPRVYQRGRRRTPAPSSSRPDDGKPHRPRSGREPAVERHEGQLGTACPLSRRHMQRIERPEPVLATENAGPAAESVVDPDHPNTVPIALEAGGCHLSRRDVQPAWEVDR